MTAVHLSASYQGGGGAKHDRQVSKDVRLPLSLAAARGSLSVVTAIDDQLVPSHHLKQPRPTLVVLADDHPTAAGPGRWRQLPELLRWANGVVIHATLGQPQHYEVVSDTTIIRQRVLLVETTPAHHAAWLRQIHSYRGWAISMLSQRCESYRYGGVPTGEAAQ